MLHKGDLRFLCNIWRMCLKQQREHTSHLCCLSLNDSTQIFSSLRLPAAASVTDTHRFLHTSTFACRSFCVDLGEISLCRYHKRLQR